MWSRTILVAACVFFLWHELLCYVQATLSCGWVPPPISTNNCSTQTRVLFVSDPQLQGRYFMYITHVDLSAQKASFGRITGCNFLRSGTQICTSGSCFEWQFFICGPTWWWCLATYSMKATRYATISLHLDSICSSPFFHGV